MARPLHYLRFNDTTDALKSTQAVSVQQLTTGFTSKRRSPWLCPAPSGGAGLFSFIPCPIILKEIPKTPGAQKGHKMNKANSKPFWRESKQAWYCWIDGHQRSLGPKKNLAWGRYRELLEKKEAAARTTALSVRQCFDYYLEHAAGFEPNTLRNRQQTFEAFLHRGEGRQTSPPRPDRRSSRSMGEIPPRMVALHPPDSHQCRHGGIQSLRQAPPDQGKPDPRRRETALGASEADNQRR